MGWRPAFVPEESRGPTPQEARHQPCAACSLSVLPEGHPRDTFRLPRTLILGPKVRKISSHPAAGTQARLVNSTRVPRTRLSGGLGWGLELHSEPQCPEEP